MATKDWKKRLTFDSYRNDSVYGVLKLRLHFQCSFFFFFFLTVKKSFEKFQLKFHPVETRTK